MRFRLTDTDTGATLYALFLFSAQGKEMPLSKEEFAQIVGIIKYYSRQGNISWFAVYSTTSSKTAIRKTIKTGKRGRPKKYIDGYAVAGHAHIALLGSENESAYSVSTRVKQALDRKWERKICQVKCVGNHLDALHFTRYCFGQADIERTGGSFDFRKYANV